MSTVVNEKRDPLKSSEMKICNNLVYNRYSLYLNRPNYEEEIMNAIFSDVPIICVYGQGGSGKSALVYNLICNIIQDDNYKDQFDKIFWFSDADNPGKLDLKWVVDEIKFYIDAPLSSSKVLLSIEDEIRNINKCFDPSRTSIIVLDNFETINDEALINYIFQKLPPSCKLIIISKYSSHYYINKGIINPRLENAITEIEISRFSIEEWKTIFKIKTRSDLLYQKWACTIEKNELDLILELVHQKLGGNIFGMLSAISQIIRGKYNNYNLVNNALGNELLYQSVFDRIISNNWEIISEESKNALIAAALKGDPIVDLEQVAAFSNMEGVLNGRPCLGSKLQKAIDECCNMSLIDCSFEDFNVSYVLNPIIFRFLNDKIEKNDCDINIINRWVKYYVDYSVSIGFCFNDITKLKSMDNPAIRSSLFKVIDYCFEHKKLEDFILITKNLRYFFYTRMIWSTGDSCIHLKRARAAHELGDFIEELEALSYYINIASKYKQFENIATYINRAHIIINTNTIPFDTYFRFIHTEALYYYSTADYKSAINCWDIILNDDRVSMVSIHDVDAATRWRLKCLLELDQYDSNEKLIHCENLIKNARKHGFTRAVIDLSLILAEEYIKLNKQIEAKEYLEAIQEMIIEANDSIYTAKFYYCNSIVMQRTADGLGFLFKARELAAIINNDLLFKWYEDVISERHLFDLEICFVRHLPTKNNLDDVFIGHLDLECDQRFIKEHTKDITSIKEQIIWGKYDLVYVSPLKRAWQTAELYATDLTMVVDDRLIERDLGDWTNVAKAKLRKTTPEAFFSNGRMNFQFMPPNGEEFETMIKRVLEFVLDVYCNCEGNRILAITHNGVITIIKCLINGDFNTERIIPQDHLDLFSTTINVSIIKQIKHYLDAKSILNP